MIFSRIHRFLVLLFLVGWYQCSLLAQNTSFIFHQTCANLSFDTAERTVFGDVKIFFDAINPKDSIFIDAVQMQLREVKVNNKPVAFRYDGRRLAIAHKFRKTKNVLSFSHDVRPKQSMYFIPTEDAIQIWTQGQGKYTSHWLPSFDDVNIKQKFELTIDYPSGFEVISNGFLKKKTPVNSTTHRWVYEMPLPMSSYLVMLAIGSYEKAIDKTQRGTTLEAYIEPVDRHKIEPTYRYTKEIFDFLENEIGVPYPWGIYRQVPLRDFLYAGMENTSSTTFSRDFVVDSIGFNDRTYVNVNAHELTHQWFGNLVTAKTGLHHWLQEGFATYYALLTEKHLFGEDHFYWELYEMAERLQRASRNDNEPIMSEKASSLTYYQKGAWALVYLRSEIGDDCFKNTIKQFLTTYAYKTATIEDFLEVVRSNCSYDTESFKRIWLTNPKFPIQEVLSILRKNQSIEDYLDFIRYHQRPISEKEEIIVRYLTTDVARNLAQETVYQLNDVPLDEALPFLELALQHSDFYVRQSALRVIEEIPESLRPSVEKCLSDPSYLSREIALVLLWQNFPEKRNAYLDISKEWRGFNDLNLRILWLSLALMTEDYALEQKPDFYDELLRYTAPPFESSVRQNALTQALFLNPNDINIFPNLVQAATHHRWQFSLFARNKIKELLKSPVHQAHFSKMATELNGEQSIVLRRILELENP